jgi:hypothetical protein
MCAKAASCLTGGSGTGVICSRVSFRTPVAGRPLGALEGVMAKLVIVESWGRLVEAEEPFQLVAGGKGREA